ncbi:hypothetical protein [Paraburkholderia bannensis]|uniref:hypothetical protein n=1 Tax=Paraburkholderia bannensis TaxID=765414 RepID=UPI002AB68532|nr:hypothetical protein [Paraburkholderia bannensis]
MASLEMAVEPGRDGWRIRAPALGQQKAKFERRRAQRIVRRLNGRGSVPLHQFVDGFGCEQHGAALFVAQCGVHVERLQTAFKIAMPDRGGAGGECLRSVEPLQFRMQADDLAIARLREHGFDGHARGQSHACVEQGGACDGGCRRCEFDWRCSTAVRIDRL